MTANRSPTTQPLRYCCIAEQHHLVAVAKLPEKHLEIEEGLTGVPLVVGTLRVPRICFLGLRPLKPTQAQSRASVANTHHAYSTPFRLLGKRTTPVLPPSRLPPKLHAGNRVFAQASLRRLLAVRASVCHLSATAGMRLLILSAQSPMGSTIL